MKQYLKRTWKNKVVAILLTLLGLVPIHYESDATALILVLIIAIPLFIVDQDFIK